MPERHSLSCRRTGGRSGPAPRSENDERATRPLQSSDGYVKIAFTGVDSVTVLRWLREGTAQGMRIGGTQHVITDSIADRMGEATEQRPNQVDLTN